MTIGRLTPAQAEAATAVKGRLLAMGEAWLDLADRGSPQIKRARFASFIRYYDPR